jgi:hypothetical protein
MPRYDEGPGIGTYLFRFVFLLILLLGLGFVVFAYMGDLSRPSAPRLVPVTLGSG